MGRRAVGRDGVRAGELAEPALVLAAGRPSYVRPALTLQHDEVEPFMDPKDLGVGCEPSVEKAKRSYSFIPHDPARW